MEFCGKQNTDCAAGIKNAASTLHAQMYKMTFLTVILHTSYIQNVMLLITCWYLFRFAFSNVLICLRGPG
jgi:hypothetical protein